MEQLLGKINNPYVIGCVLVIYAMGWLFTKSREAAEWKDFFSNNRLDELRQAKDELKNVHDEAEFYEEAIRQEIFHRQISIRCCKKNRKIYQSLVRDGIASTEGIRLAYFFIDSNNSKVEIRFGCLDWMQAIFLIILLFFGGASIPYLLQDILLNINQATLLFRLSIAILFFFGALKGLLPMVVAQNIEKRLKEFEKKNRECVPEQNNTLCEQSALPESSL